MTDYLDLNSTLVSTQYLLIKLSKNCKATLVITSSVFYTLQYMHVNVVYVSYSISAVCAPQIRP